MRRMPRVLATAVSAILLVCGVAAADTITANFENPPFHPGSVAGQDGWRSAVPGNVPALPSGYDQAVVTNVGAPAAFGTLSLRLSNRYANGEFFYQTYFQAGYSPSRRDAAQYGVHGRVLVHP
jgi:hypothetical protein